ncbi:DUF2149 domain-containing protein [Chitinophaga sp. Cy-1792]|uniref:DUF2149 domain-containing protein n=1 Tax=Chitinophaga sp. Cy-1792 TaxID=2608339 RepID=UPI00141F71EF|nr:DUF2149 domain-containing protein [Chitinophaga sp. Cy-1792]NIG56474.1 DUF2149 domain-containing protein [Chitinophaga sp. Cy-1792]
MKRYRRRYKGIGKSDDDVNPIHAIANLFDVSIVFAVALMVALVSRYKMNEVFSKEDYTIVKNPGKEDMQIITKKGTVIQKYNAAANSDNSPQRNKGKRVGAAWQLENGEVVYIPE